jgi:hypothetical protein
MLIKRKRKRKINVNYFVKINYLGFILIRMLLYIYSTRKHKRKRLRSSTGDGHPDCICCSLNANLFYIYTQSKLIYTIYFCIIFTDVYDDIYWCFWCLRPILNKCLFDVYLFFTVFNFLYLKHTKLQIENNLKN